MRDEIAALQAAMEAEGYIADPAIATALFLFREMRRPLLIEGDAGVGKTEIAKVLARLLDTELIRLQCYEGLDVSTALYEWNYQRQMLRLRMAEDEGKRGRALRAHGPRDGGSGPLYRPPAAGPQSRVVGAAHSSAGCVMGGKNPWAWRSARASS